MTNEKPVRPPETTTQPLLAVEGEGDDEASMADEEDDWIDGMQDEIDEAQLREEEKDLFAPDIEEEVEDIIDGEDVPPRLARKAEQPHEGAPDADERVPENLPEPVKPSAEVVSRHNCTHLPYRSW